MTNDCHRQIADQSAIGVRADAQRLPWRPGWFLALVLLVYVSASGASCPRVMQQYTQPIPRALPQSASLTQIIDVVNDNSARVQSLSSSRATVATPGLPSLNANIAFQRPRSFRLIGEKFGPQVDMGSNDEQLWFWFKHAPPPAVYVCRHDQFATSAARQIMPVEPEWLVEAFGIITFDRSAKIEGPAPVGTGRVEIRSRSGPPGAEMQRITVIDDSLGVVLEQHMYDARGTLLASASLSKHSYDPASGAKLPRHIEIQFPPAKMQLSIDLAELQVNQLPSDPSQLFAKPVYPGYEEIDLAQPPPHLIPTNPLPPGAVPSGAVPAGLAPPGAPLGTAPPARTSLVPPVNSPQRIDSQMRY